MVQNLWNMAKDVLRGRLQKYRHTSRRKISNEQPNLVSKAGRKEKAQSQQEKGNNRLEQK